MEEASELYMKSMSAIKNTKSKFGKIIKFINQNPDIRKQLTPVVTSALKRLIQLWKNNDEANMEYYFSMKEHHSHINGQMEHDTLQTMWDDYIKSCVEFRCNLMAWNHLCHSTRL